MVFGERLRALSGSTPRRPPSNIIANHRRKLSTSGINCFLLDSQYYSDNSDDTASSFVIILLFKIRIIPDINQHKEDIVCKVIISGEW